MTFSELLHLIIIRGYCEKQPQALRKMLKQSVDCPEQISFDDAVLCGYIRGDPIRIFAKTVLDAGFHVEKLATYLESMYETRHRDTKTFNDRYGKKRYKDALFEKAHPPFPELTYENMSEVLAEGFETILRTAAEEATDDSHAKSAEQSPHFTDDTHCAMLDRYTIDEKEKAAIINSSGLVLKELRDIMWQTNRIDRKQHELKTMKDDKDDEGNQRLREYLQYELEKLRIKLDESYAKLAKLCSDAIILLDPKKHLHTSMAKLSETAHKLKDESNTFRITSPDSFRYSALSTALKDFENHFNRLKRDWNTV